jgi:hypothetical protein
MDSEYPGDLLCNNCTSENAREKLGKSKKKEQEVQKHLLLFDPLRHEPL